MAAAQRHSVVWDLLAALCIPLGAWLVASPYVLEFWLYDALRINCTLLGGTILSIAVAQLALSPGLRWLGWFNVVLGLWLAAMPFVTGTTDLAGATLSTVASGLAVALASAASILGARG